ncbi:MAG: hypothetical protein A3B68_05020 [Candidatus Melainabacteria bacterium RIFCSPHIGHO2_02_FULL_34_12]|nr:MAG: hypothetical protein A3B68_05020 [Candidatus Melainabacteria bacterium RIFCSPHIGHO2_02_FULL_34_12]
MQLQGLQVHVDPQGQFRLFASANPPAVRPRAITKVNIRFFIYASFFSALNLTHEIYGRVNSIIPYPPGMGIKMIKTA